MVRTLEAVAGLRVAVAQVASDAGDPEKNLAVARRYMGMAASRGASVIVFPECFIHGYSTPPGTDGEATNGPHVQQLRALARSLGIAVVAGLVERRDESSRPFDSAVVIDREGKLAGTYRKTHLYGEERKWYSAGSAYPVFPLRARLGSPPVPLGVAICADIEYPEVIRIMTLSGALLVAVLSANMEPFRYQQKANLASRAIENNVYVALANTIGASGDHVFFGGSGIAGPAGSLVSAGYGRPRLAVASISLDEYAESGGVGNYHRGRRPDTYQAIVAPKGAD
jgi:predicted amidohydrolase